MSRARTDAAKEERRAQLVAAARDALDAGASPTTVTLSEVIVRTGLSKGTAYLYFPTKEALFLQVLDDDLRGWFDALGEELGEGPLAPACFAERFADSLLRRPRLVGLLGLLHAVLEANLDLPTARAFKRSLAAGLTVGDATLVARLPGFADGDGARLLVTAHALTVGLSAMAAPSPAIDAALAEPELAWMRVDLRTELVRALTALVAGHATTSR